MTIPTGDVHLTQILISGLAADLLVIDIANVQVGDLIILGGRHIRRILTAPVNRLDKATGKFAFYTAPVTHRPDDPLREAFGVPGGAPWVKRRGRAGDSSSPATLPSVRACGG